MRILVLLVALLLLPARPGLGQAGSLPRQEAFTTFVWHQQLSGAVGGAKNLDLGTGVLQPDRDTSVGFTLRLGNWDLAYTRINHEAVGYAVRTFEFQGLRVAGTDPFRLSHRLSYLSIYHRLDLRASERLGLHLQLGFELASVSTQLLDIRSREIASLDETVPVPHLGLTTRLGAERRTHGLLRGRFSQLSHHDVSLRMADFSVSLARSVGARGRVALGWRWLLLDVEVEKRPGRSGRLDIENDGLFLEIGKRF